MSELLLLENKDGKGATVAKKKANKTANKKAAGLTKYQRHCKRTIKAGGSMATAARTWSKSEGRPKSSAIYSKGSARKKKPAKKRAKRRNAPAAPATGGRRPNVAKKANKAKTKRKSPKRVAAGKKAARTRARKKSSRKRPSKRRNPAKKKGAAKKSQVAETAKRVAAAVVGMAVPEEIGEAVEGLVVKFLPSAAGFTQLDKAISFGLVIGGRKLANKYLGRAVGNAFFLGGLAGIAKGLKDYYIGTPIRDQLMPRLGLTELDLAGGGPPLPAPGTTIDGRGYGRRYPGDQVPALAGDWTENGW